MCHYSFYLCQYKKWQCCCLLGCVPYPYMDTQMPHARNIYGYDPSLTELRRRAHKYDASITEHSSTRSPYSSQSINVSHISKTCCLFFVLYSSASTVQVVIRVRKKCLLKKYIFPYLAFQNNIFGLFPLFAGFLHNFINRGRI